MSESNSVTPTSGSGTVIIMAQIGVKSMHSTLGVNRKSLGERVGCVYNYGIRVLRGSQSGKLQPLQSQLQWVQLQGHRQQERGRLRGVLQRLGSL